ncbi:GNAT family N-acetyltransferase [Paenibacillus sp. JX-17]|uniref:GNAT family N-acetyltransferase n=1 Tax=Paenibacillus lacisoli TaxID=3064525 RepID=A0ABT9CCL8_9BACL|nr:GNAT family N-acetyltransferase [Paenibacillus sp. JX-17]MDO7907009.1 GNAT family N-acetyltransferase [Paenibacillus sp. JX-17]
MQLIIETMAWGSVRYLEGLELRDEVLRRPLGMSIADDPTDQEQEDCHICAVAENVLVGVLLLRRIDDRTLQMKQVAVAASARGRNVGRMMVCSAEQLAKEQGYGMIILHARATAVPFYEKLGYSLKGAPYMEVGIPHRSMIKQLA